MSSSADVDPRDADTVVIPLHAEEVLVTRRTSQGATVRVTTVTHDREQPVEELLTHERVEVERVPIGRPVTAVPPVREEGDTTIMSVVEEIVVIERRLILKEEIHIRRVRTTEHHRESVMLRTQDAVITRVEAGTPRASDARQRLATDPTPIPQEQTA